MLDGWLPDGQTAVQILEETRPGMKDLDSCSPEMAAFFVNNAAEEIF